MLVFVVIFFNLIYFIQWILLLFCWFFFFKFPLLFKGAPCSLQTRLKSLHKVQFLHRWQAAKEHRCAPPQQCELQVQLLNNFFNSQPYSYIGQILISCRAVNICGSPHCRQKSYLSYLTEVVWNQSQKMGNGDLLTTWLGTSISVFLDSFTLQLYHLSSFRELIMLSWLQNKDCYLKRWLLFFHPPSGPRWNSWGSTKPSTRSYTWLVESPTINTSWRTKG